MVQVLERHVNLFNLDLEEVEIEKIVQLWHPQAQDSIASVKNKNIVRLQSVNQQTEFAEIRVNETERSTISIAQLKEEYVPVFTFLQAEALIGKLPPEYEGLKEKLREVITE